MVAGGRGTGLGGGAPVVGQRDRDPVTDQVDAAAGHALRVEAPGDVAGVGDVVAQGDRRVELLLVEHDAGAALGHGAGVEPVQPEEHRDGRDRLGPEHHRHRPGVEVDRVRGPLGQAHRRGADRGPVEVGQRPRFAVGHAGGGPALVDAVAHGVGGRVCGAVALRVGVRDAQVAGLAEPGRVELPPRLDESRHDLGAVVGGRLAGRRGDVVEHRDLVGLDQPGVVRVHGGDRDLVEGPVDQVGQALVGQA